ncbi:MAG TPA: hypothetical protein VJU84_14805 [Pyrinomonadaceae bacterium]|nr:hypothetical protein [Pyrinomonadaceae bacterium]
MLQKTYDYHSDGRMDHAFDSIDNRYDRRYRFDQTGRVKEATSGAEARGTGAMDGPYSSAITYDVWGNTTQKTGQHWIQPTSESATYVNNRRSGWNYDAEGNMLDDGTYQALQRKYDAAGRMSQIMNPAFPGNPKRTDEYDGNGQRARSGYHQPGCSPEFICPFEYFYYLRSSVLGEQIIAEIGQTGQCREAYVYTPSGSLVAKHKSPTPNDVSEYLLWEHRDPAAQVSWSKLQKER